MNIDWSMVGAIAGIIAVLLVLIIEADKLFPRLVTIGKVLAMLIITIYGGSLLLAIVGGIPLALVGLFVELPPVIGLVAGGIRAFVGGGMGVVAIALGFYALIRVEIPGVIDPLSGLSGWKRLWVGLLSIACGIAMLYLVIITPLTK